MAERTTDDRANPPLPEARRPSPSPEAQALAKDIDFAIDLTIPREAMLRRFEELLDTFARAVAREALEQAASRVAEMHEVDGMIHADEVADWLRARAAQQETP